MPTKKASVVRIVILPVFLYFFSTAVQAQHGFLQPSSQYNASRLKGVVISELAGGVIVSTGLYYLWYRKHPRSHFHFFDDNGEWLQMDKIGHLTTAYNIAGIQYDIMRWCGVKRDASVAIGSFTALGYMSIIEVLDGFSSKWGFSKGDMAANLIGTALFASQQQFWGQQRISMKFSYHGTIYPTYRPEELGRKWTTSIIKDYNGQTYWLSFNIGSFMRARDNFPAWLNLNVGYGAQGMISGRILTDSVSLSKYPSFQRYRQFYLAPDIDFKKIPSTSNFFNTAAYLTQFIKTPAPALEWNTVRKLRLYPIYF